MGCLWYNQVSNILPFSFLVEFENLGKAFSKAKAVVDKEGIPQFYIRSLTELEDFVKEVIKESRTIHHIFKSKL